MDTISKSIIPPMVNSKDIPTPTKRIPQPIGTITFPTIKTTASFAFLVDSAIDTPDLTTSQQLESLLLRYEVFSIETYFYSRAEGITCSLSFIFMYLFSCSQQRWIHVWRHIFYFLVSARYERFCISEHSLQSTLCSEPSFTVGNPTFN